MKDNEDPAFPKVKTNVAHYCGELYGDVSSVGGLTKREWFAGMSLMGRRANPNIDQLNINAEWCFSDADEMIEASKK